MFTFESCLWRWIQTQWADWPWTWEVPLGREGCSDAIPDNQSVHKYYILIVPYIKPWLSRFFHKQFFNISGIHVYCKCIMFGHEPVFYLAFLVEIISAKSSTLFLPNFIHINHNLLYTWSWLSEHLDLTSATMWMYWSKLLIMLRFLVTTDRRQTLSKSRVAGPITTWWSCCGDSHFEQSAFSTLVVGRAFSPSHTCKS